MGFKGSSLNKFDEAGRISLPMKMREELKSNGYGNTLTVYCDNVDKCIKLLPKSVYIEKIEKFYEDKLTDEESRRRYRPISSSANDVTINGSGRINISTYRTSDYGFGNEDECWIIGMGNTIEIWSKKAWEEEQAKWNKQ